ncbi:MAG TPA: glycosyltransferase family 39 protein, partial [Chthoniobacterales bacterium]
MNNSDLRAWFVRSWPLLGLLFIAAIWLYRTPYSASNLEVLPDSVEYALAPLQLLETGRYEIIVEGRGLPPRYPPWFPVLVILPAYLLFGHEPGNAILPITVLAVGGVGLAYAIGKRISLTAGGVLAALVVLSVPAYGHWSAKVMTDVPCTTLMLGACLLYLHLRARSGAPRLYFAAGVLVAVTTLFRPVFASMLLPFLLAIVTQRKNLFLRTGALLTPVAAAAAATFTYNAATFGSPFRTGYKFWLPAPMDYPSMVFSLSHIRANLTVIGLIGVPILFLAFVAAIFLARSFRPAGFAASRESYRGALLFFALTAGPILLFHIIYFFPDDRFYLPILAGLAVLTGSILGLVVGPGRETPLKVLLLVIFLVAVAVRLVPPAATPSRRLAADQVRQHTPENAVIISGIDPVYLARLAGRGSARRIVPLSRNVEF